MDRVLEDQEVKNCVENLLEQFPDGADLTGGIVGIQWDPTSHTQRFAILNIFSVIDILGLVDFSGENIRLKRKPTLDEINEHGFIYDSYYDSVYNTISTVCALAMMDKAVEWISDRYGEEAAEQAEIYLENFA